MQTRNERKSMYRAARDIARWIAAGPATDDGVRLRVDAGANVHLVEDGAFIEASIFVPLAVFDSVGRLIAPPQTEPAPRAPGPWDSNGK